MLKTAMISATALLFAGIAAPASTATPNRIEGLMTTKVQDSYEQCLLNAGCFHTGPTATDPGTWVCPNPRLAMDCLQPADPGVP